MSFRHRLILLLTSACGAVALLCPVGGLGPTASLGPIVSAAPPLFAAGAAAGEDSALMNALRLEAGLALGQLQGRGDR